MKKAVLLLVMVVGFFSCSNNVEFNNPAMQAKKDGEIWKGTSFRANVDANGRLTITGSSDDTDNLTLRVTSTVLATYELGNTVSEATYNDGVSTLYSTNNSPDPTVSLYEPDGQIEIYEYDSENKVVSGRFNFNAFDISGFKTINFNQGDFYRVPVTGETIDNSCDIATQLVTTTETVFNATPTSDPNYSTACNSYKDALTNKINACGDDSGSLQAIIDTLGDCTVGVDPCDIATANANAAETAYNAVPNTDAQYPTVCNDYKTALLNKITQCGDANGSIQAIIDSLGNCTIVTGSPCDIATANADMAEIVFNGTPNTDPQYPTACNDYKSALQIKITECGDPTGSIQTIIDGLGDCSAVTTTGVISVDLGTAGLTFEEEITVTPNGTDLNVSAKDGSSGNIVSFTVGQGATGIDIITNFMIQIGPAGGTTYIPTTDPAEVFTSNITINNGTVINGTFSGTIQATGAAAPDLTLNNGVIDIMY